MEREAVWRSLHAYFHKRCHAQGEVWIHRIWRQGSPLPPWQSFSFFRKVSLPCVLAGLGSCSKFHPVPLLPALSPITRVIKHPSERPCGTDCSVIFSEIKSNLAKAGFVGSSKGPYWCELPGMSGILVSEIFYDLMKIPASMLRFWFCIHCCLTTWEMARTVMFALTKMSLKEQILQIWGFGLIGSSWGVGLLALAPQEQRTLSLGADHHSYKRSCSLWTTVSWSSQYCSGQAALGVSAWVGWIDAFKMPLSTSAMLWFVFLAWGIFLNLQWVNLATGGTVISRGTTELPFINLLMF